MLWIGKNISQLNDPLASVSVEQIYFALKNEGGNVADLQKQLRIMRGMDYNKYRKMKTVLPYIVFGQFHPRYRQKNNFVSVQRFILDIDNLGEYEIDIIELKKRLINDTRVELLFISPGGDGLKILFKLKEAISDSGYYSMFYKAFALLFAAEHHIEGAVDLKTCDVTRCCFVSFDPDAYYNKDAEPVNAAAILDENDHSELDVLKIRLNEAEKNRAQILKDLPEEERKQPKELSDDILNGIKQKIGQRARTVRVKHYEQPEELKGLMPQLEELFTSVGLQLQKNNPIAYGRQIRVEAADLWAEINIFYGKKGVRIVGTTKTGSNRDLCDMTVSLLKDNFENN